MTTVFKTHSIFEFNAPIRCPYCLDFQNDVANHIYTCDCFIVTEMRKNEKKCENIDEKKLSYADIVKINTDEGFRIPDALLSLINTDFPYYDLEEDNDEFILNVSKE
jgi:hypothetical protein